MSLLLLMSKNSFISKMCRLLYHLSGTPRRGQVQDVARIQLVVSDEIAALLDEGVGLLALQTRKRQTRTSLIVRAIRSEVERLKAETPSSRDAEHTR